MKTKQREITALSTVQFIGYGPSGLPRYFHVLVDITHLKEMEQELALKKKELEVVEYQCNIMQKFFDSAPMQMGLVHATNLEECPHIVHSFINPAAADQLGAKQVDLIDFDISEVLSKDALNIWASKMRVARE